MQQPTILVFLLDSQRYALRLDATLRVLPMVEIAPLPAAPAAVLGVVGVAGQLLPVMDLRHRFGLPAREFDLSDVLIIARTAARTVLLPADAVCGVAEIPPAAEVHACDLGPGLDQLAGVTQIDGELVFIHDLDAFLAPRERTQLDSALGAIREPA